MNRISIAMQSIIIWLTICAPVVVAQSQLGSNRPDATNEETPLARKQRMIFDRYNRFQDRIFRLREQLSETEPENAQRLAKALDRSGELGLRDRLEDIIRLLDDIGSSDTALDAQTKWVEDADSLLNILMQRDSVNEDRRSEIDKLNAYQKRVQQLLKDQRLLRDEVDQHGKHGEISKQIDDALKQLQNIQEQQGELLKATAPKSTDTHAEKNSADQPSSQQEQEALAKQTEALSEQVEKLADQMPDENSSDQDKASSQKDASNAAKSLSQASSNMSQAKQSMQQGDSPSAQAQQQSAKQALDQAKKQLENAKEKLKKSNNSDDSAKRQQELSEQTKKLEEQMKSDQQSGQSKQENSQNSNPQSQQSQKSQKGQQGQQSQQGESGKQNQSQQQQQEQSDQQDSPSDQEQPGLENIENAEKEMEDATESLKQEKSEEALPQQDRAIEELEQAELELEEALSQLRQEDRAETLRHLEARFRVLLSKQKVINAETLVLDHIGRDAFKRPEKLRVAELAAKQGALSEKAGSCAHILDEDGTTIVFPYVVEQITKDMQTVSQRLSLLRTGLLTQQIEQEIIDALQQLLESVKKMQQENEEQGGQQGQQGKKDDSLLPLSGELKLLKSMQLRINSRTSAIHQAQQAGDESPDSLLSHLKATSSRQSQTEGVAKKMRERVDAP